MERGIRDPVGLLNSKTGSVVGSHYNLPGHDERKRSDAGVVASIGFAALAGVVVAYAAMHWLG
jgi:hypothetical protein